MSEETPDVDDASKPLKPLGLSLQELEKEEVSFVSDGEALRSVPSKPKTAQAGQIGD